MLLCTIARFAKEKERIRFIVQAFTYKPTVVISHFSLFLLYRWMELLA